MNWGVLVTAAAIAVPMSAVMWMVVVVCATAAPWLLGAGIFAYWTWQAYRWLMQDRHRRAAPTA